MSSREPLWYCHECNAEMRPLMVPDPHCASCNGTFVERIENPADDPREFQLADGGHWGDGPLPEEMEMDPFLAGLRTMLRGPNPPPTATSPANQPFPSTGTDGRRASTDGVRSPTTPQVHTAGRSGHFTIRIERPGGSGGRTRTVILGGSPGGGNNDDIPRLSQFAPPRNADGIQQDRPNITGPMLAQYLLALMGPGHGADPFSDLLGGVFGPGRMPGGGQESGRWGDYVFNQEALDQIITQIMENNNAHQPVPASEEVLGKLPREVLEQGSPLLEKDCAVCKEQFKLETDDPDEQVVISLPCHHPFHEPCIIPWLKTSGTCPVCRYQLVPQPEPHTPGRGPPSGDSSRSNSSSSSGGNGAGGSNGAGPGILHNVFSMFSNPGVQSDRGSTNRSNSNAGSQNQPANTSTARGGQTSSRQDDDYDLPGGWGDQID